jgi:hypothetical protein
MATDNQIDVWYNTYAKQMIKDQLGINLYHSKDARRLRVPSLDGNNTRALFENGFLDNIADKRKLYEYAQNGTLFAFSKKDDAVYQITDRGINTCGQEKETENQTVPMGKKAGYFAVGLIWSPARFLIGLTGRVFNLLTLGLLEEPVSALGRGLDMMTGAWSERLFSVEAQEAEKERKVGFGERLGNKLTLGQYKKEKIESIDREKEFALKRENMQKVLASEQKEWEKYNKEEIAEKEKEQKQSRIEDALENTKQQLKEVEKPLDNEATTDEQLPQDAKELKSKLKLQYEEMKMAFGPDGGGFTNAIRIAKDMNVLIQKMQENPELLKNSGMNAEKLQQFSNMCKNMEKIGVEGLNAKKDLMIVDECSKLSPQEKEQRICQLQLMNMVEKAMVNSAYRSLLPGNDNKKTSSLINAMHKDPSVFEDELYRGIKMLESTEELKDMTPEEIAEYISEPEKVRQTLDEEVAKGAMKNREQHTVARNTEKEKERQKEELEVNRQA